MNEGTADSGCTTSMEPDTTRLFDVESHRGYVTGYDGSQQLSIKKGKYTVCTTSGPKVLKEVWVVPEMTEPLVSLPAFVSQLNMSLLLDKQGLHELVPQQNGLYARNKLLATYQNSTWTMVPGVISGSELVGDNETARLGTFHLPSRTNKTVTIKDSFVPKSRELLIHLRSGCLSRSGMLEMIRHDAVRNHGCTKEGVEGIGIGTSLKT